jgi:hypothetical protein
MWAAHFLYHLNTGFVSIGSLFQRMALDSGVVLFGNPQWNASSVITAESLTALQLLLLDAGFLFALYVLWRIAAQLSSDIFQSIWLQIPWALVTVALYIFGVWIFLNPMEMRGVMVH